MGKFGRKNVPVTKIEIFRLSEAIQVRDVDQHDPPHLLTMACPGLILAKWLASGDISVTNWSLGAQ